MNRHLKSFFAYAAFLAAGLALGYVAMHIPAWIKPAYVQGDYRAYFANTPHKVVLYSTSWCQYCAKTRAYFIQRNIAYDEQDIDKSPAARKQFAQLGGGGIPKVLIGDRMIGGFAPDAFEAALEKVQSVPQ